MKLATMTDCAIRMLLCLASEKRLIVSGEFSRKIGLDRKYLLSVGKQLKKAGLVHITLGPFGGYSLAKPPEDISLYDIAQAFDDNLQCSSLTGLTDKAVLMADIFYGDIEDTVTQAFKSTNLATMLARKNKNSMPRGSRR